MSCNSNSNRGRLAAVACGVSKMGSTAAYTAAAVGGGVAGGATGVFLGGVGGPVGMVIGGTVGGALGATVAKKAVDEGRWRKSEEGRQARRTRDRAIEDSELEYQARDDKLSVQKKYFKQKFMDARDAGVASMPADAKDTAKIAGAVAAKAVGGAVLKTGAAMLRQYSFDQGTDQYLRKQVAVATARREAVRQAGSFAGQVEQEKTNRWLKTPGGQKAQAEYVKSMREIKVKRARNKQAHEARLNLAETAYSRQREDFLDGA
ncbi:MAG: hypothetical protein Kow0031_24770 [Anaerolineae bacterium]